MDRCEHYGWKLLASRFSRVVHADNWVLLKCAGCGAFWCLHLAAGELDWWA